MERKYPTWIGDVTDGSREIVCVHTDGEPRYVHAEDIARLCPYWKTPENARAALTAARMEALPAKEETKA